MNRKSWCVGLGVSLVALLSAAAVSAASWSTYGYVSIVEVDSSSTVPLVFLTFASSPAVTKPSCSTQVEVVSSANADGTKAIAALVTSAFLAGKQVAVYFDGTCNSSGYAKFLHARIQ
jgi:hypothetical protein